jgi:hypothetical protein
MQSQPIGVPTDRTDAMDGDLVVSRDGDDRWAFVAADAARDPRVRDVTGGRCRLLERPMLMVIVDCTSLRVPEGGRFAHDCGGPHGPGPHRI